MSDIKDLLVKESLNLPQDKLNEIGTHLSRQGIRYLNGDQERGLFLMYSLGCTFDEIVSKTNVPWQVVALTAIKYNWKDKLLNLGDTREIDAKELGIDILEMLIKVTNSVITKEAAEIQSGAKDIADARFIPKNIKSFMEVMTLYKEITSSKEPDNKPGNTVIHASGPVQVNQGLPAVNETDKVITEEERLVIDRKRQEKLKALDS